MPGWVRLLATVVIVGASCRAVAAELQIANSSGSAIRELYVAAIGERSWGVDRLRVKQPGVIARGETHTVTDLAPGSYQVMMVDDQGSECEIDFVDISSTYRIDLTSRRLQECTSSH
jgi:hypothetical protein